MNSRCLDSRCLLLLAWLLLLWSASPSPALPETLVAPAGEYRVAMPVGHTVWVYGLVTADAWTGTVEGAVTNSTILPGQVLTQFTLGGEAMNVGALASGPQYVEVLDGYCTGLVLDIHSGTPGTLLVHGNWATLEPGTRLAVRAHATLGTMFPGPDCGLVAGSDVVMVPCTDANGDLEERWFTHNGSNWEDGGAVNSDGIVVYPGQGILFSLGEQPGGGAREIVFGRGPVCHIKTTPTLVALHASWNAALFSGPVWPVETDQAGGATGLRTVAATELGLEQTLEPWSDIACVMAWNGLLDTTAVFYSDGTQLVDAVTMESGPALASSRFVKGAGIYLSVLTSKYWLTQGVP